MVVFSNRGDFGGYSLTRFQINVYPLNFLRDAIWGQYITPLIQAGLNFIMFVPGGFLLAWSIPGKPRWQWGIVPLVSLLIEISQFFFGCGIADIDDLLLNTLGGWWGILLHNTIAEFKHGKANHFNLVLDALPVIIFAGAIICYTMLPYGLLPEDAANPYSETPKNISFSFIEPLPKSLPVYKVKAAEKEDAYPQIQKIFAAMGTEVDDATKDEYDTCIVYRGKIPVYYLWYNYDGSFELLTGDRGVPLPKGVGVETGVLTLLKNMGFDLPSNFKREERTPTTHVICFSMEEENGVVYDGEIEYSADEDILYELNYNVLSLTVLQDEKTEGEEAVKERILRGRFSCNERIDGSEWEFVGWEIKYRRDSKGFYRPCYSLALKDNGKETTMIVPAIDFYKSALLDDNSTL